MVSFSIQNNPSHCDKRYEIKGSTYLGLQATWGDKRSKFHKTSRCLFSYITKRSCLKMPPW